MIKAKVNQGHILERDGVRYQAGDKVVLPKSDFGTLEKAKVVKLIEKIEKIEEVAEEVAEKVVEELGEATKEKKSNKKAVKDED